MKIRNSQNLSRNHFITNYVNDTIFDELYLKIFHLFFLFLYFADPTFSMIVQIENKAVV